MYKSTRTQEHQREFGREASPYAGSDSLRHAGLDSASIRIGIHLLFGLLITAVLSPCVQAQEKEKVKGDRDVEVSFVETEIGFDQIVEDVKPAYEGDPEQAMVPGSRTGMTNSPPGTTDRPPGITDRHPGLDPGPKTSATPLDTDTASAAGLRISPEEVVQVNRSLKNLIEENAQLQSEKENLGEQLKNYRGQYRLDKNRMDAVLKERDDYKREAEQIIQTNRGYQTDIQTLRAQLDRQKEDLEAKIEALNSMGSEIQGLKQQLATKEKVLENKMISAEVDPRFFEKEQAALKEEVADLNIRLREQEQTASDLKKEKEILTRQLAERQERIETLQKNPLAKDLEKEISEMQDTIAGLKEREKDLKEASSALERKVLAKEDRIKDLEARFEQAQAVRGDSDKTSLEVSRLNARISGLQEREAALKQETETLRDRLGEKEAEIKGLLAKRKNSNTALASSHKTPDLIPGTPASEPFGFAQDRPGATGSRIKSGMTNIAAPNTSHSGLDPESTSPLSPEAVQEVARTQQESMAVVRMVEDLGRENKEILEDEGKIHYNMGTIYFKQGQYKRAISEFKKAVALRPEDASAHFNLAFVAGEYMRDHRTALAHYKKYLYLNPGAGDVALVQEKIIDAEMYLRAEVDDMSLEKDLTAHKRGLGGE